jgi:four helix bundle protein
LGDETHSIKPGNCKTEQSNSLSTSSRPLQDYPMMSLRRIIGRQLLRSGTSLAANYRSACRARSAADFISKISGVAEETDQTLFWLELLVQTEMIKSHLVGPLMSECSELLRIFSASLATAKRNR